MDVLVTGGTGLIGSHAVAGLLGNGHRVRLLVRDPSKVGPVLSPLGWDAGDVEVFEGSLASNEEIRRALEGCDGLLHCAGLFSPNRQDEALLVKTNVQGTERVLAEAEGLRGVQRVVYISSMLALFPPRAALITADDDVARPTSMYAKTKADAERIARDFQSRLPLTIVYPAAVQGPHDPTFSIGPQLVAGALKSREVLVTEGGLATTDVRDLASLVVAVFEGASSEGRIMAPSFFVPHDRYHAVLEELSGRQIKARRIPGWLLRVLGRGGDVAQRLGIGVQLTYEAAEVLTRSVPLDDRHARAVLGRPPIDDEASFRDLIVWMFEAGHLDAESAGRLRTS